MKTNQHNKLKYLLCVLCIVLFSLAGYFFISSPLKQTKEDTWANSGFLKIGHSLTIKNADNTLNLSDNKDVLSASGLYYATWTMGDHDETVDLYDAQLYLLLSEHKDTTEAGNDMVKWIDLAKTNYQILTEEEIICNGQPYSLITYTCVSEDNPYDRGISAFGVCGKAAMCFELTCREGFDKDLKNIMVSFLNNCTY